MTEEEERREIARNSYAAQMEMLGYEPDGNPKDMVEIVRCRDCKHHLDCGLWIDNGDDWFCADGERENDGKN